MRYVHDRGIIKRSAIRVGVISAVFVLAAQAVTGVLSTRTAQAIMPGETIVLPTDFANDASHWTFHDDIKDSTDPLHAATPTQTENHKTDHNPTPTEGDNGAVKLSADDGEKWNLATMLYSGTKLSDISGFSFDVYSDNPSQSYVNVDVNFNSLDYGPGIVDHGRLIYVPQGVGINAWSHQEAAGSGEWRWSKFHSYGDKWPDGEASPTRTWDDIKATFPNAYVSSTVKQIVLGADHFGGVYFRADGDNPVTAYYDHVQITTPSQSTLYNFELPKPDAPTLVSPADGAIVQGASLTNVWDPVPGADHYIYESYKDAAASEVRWTQNVAGTSKTATNVADTTFWWRVKAVDGDGVESDWSELWKLTVDNTAPQWLPGPYHLWPNNNAEVEEGSEIIMQWVDATDANEGIKYFYQVSKSSEVQSIGGEFVSPIWTFGPLDESQLDSTGTAVGEYYWHVRACDAADNCTPWTDPWRGSVVESQASEEETEEDQGVQLQGAPAPGNFPLQFAVAGVGPGPDGGNPAQSDGNTDGTDGDQGEVLGVSDESTDTGGNTSESGETSPSKAKFVIPAAVAGGGSLWWLIAAALRRRSGY